MQLIVVATTITNSRQYPSRFQISYNALGGAFGDTHLLGHIAQPQKRILGQTDQHMTVIAQKGPGISFGTEEVGLSRHNALVDNLITLTYT